MKNVQYRAGVFVLASVSRKEEVEETAMGPF